MKNSLTYRINSYYAVLLITIIGAGAASLIIHVANTGGVFVAQGELGQVSAYLRGAGGN